MSTSTPPIESIQLEVPGPGGPLVLDSLSAGPAGAELVLLCHGFPTTSHSWRRLMVPLAAAGYRAVAPDGRGLSPGARPSEVAAYHVDHLVADVLACADRLGAQRFHLIGHDWGGLQAWQVAGRHPERVATLSVLSTPHNRALREARDDPHTDQAARSAYFDVFRTPGAGEDMWLAKGSEGLREMYDLAGLSPEECAPYVEAFCERAALTGLLNWYRAGEPTWDEGLGAIRVPTLYCWGSEDPALGREAAERTARWVEAPYRFEVFEGMGHWLPEHGGARLARLVLEQLASR